MGSISNATSQVSAPPRTYLPAVENLGVEAGGGVPARRAPVMGGDSLTSTIRIGTPLYKVGLEEFGGVAQSWFGRIFHGSGPIMKSGWGSLGNGLENAGAAGGAAGGFIGGGASGVLSGVGSAFRNAFGVFKGALKSNFLVAAAVSGVTNALDVIRGQSTPQRAIATFAADTAVYTGIGAASTTIGALLGSLIPIPFVGTALGIAVGMGLGFLYEKTFRQNAITSTQAMFTR